MKEKKAVPKLENSHGIRPLHSEDLDASPARSFHSRACAA